MLQGIDYTGKPIGNIDFIEASWDRNWSEAGDFMVYMALAEYNRLNALGIKYVKMWEDRRREFSRNYSMTRKPKALSQQ